MKKSEFIKLLEQVPEDAEIFHLHCEETLGYYDYCDPYVSQVQAKKYINKKGYVCYASPISNYWGEDAEDVQIWEIS